jgi:hypothetical protein
MQVLDSPSMVVTDDRFSSTNLEQIVDYYEKIVTEGDTSNQNYWYLGLAYLLQAREIDAQATWFIPFEDASELESASLNSELSVILHRSAAQEFAADNLDHAWLISQYLREIDPSHLNNLFRSILLEIRLEQFTPAILDEWEATELVSNHSSLSVDRDLLAELLQSLLLFPSEQTGSFINICLLNLLSTSTDSIEDFVNDIRNIAHRTGANSFMAEILEFCSKIQPKNFNIANILSRIYSDLGSHDKAIDVARYIYNLCDNSFERIQSINCWQLAQGKYADAAISGINRRIWC